MRIWDRARRTPSRPARHRHRRPLWLELLEDRLAPATITVTTRADDITPNDGSVSLREAITAINAGNDLGDPNITAQSPGAFGTNDAIHFNIQGTAPFQIDVGSDPSAAGIPLPQIVKPVVIDATTQTGFAGKPVVVVNGASAGAIAANGFDVELGTGVFSSGVTIRGFVINGFPSGSGVVIGPDNVSGSGGFANRITGNFIGTDASGTVARPNGNGVFVIGIDSNNLGLAASNNLIAGNVISGNVNDGVQIRANVNGIATGNLVSGNFIGTTAAGTAALPNGTPGSLSQIGSSGVEIFSASGNLVGGTNISGNSITGVSAAALTATAGAGNVIAGNAANGIHISGTLTDPANTNGVAANFIGVDVTGNAALGNARFGIELSGAQQSTVGGEAAGDRNVVGANGTGVVLDNGAQNNFVSANFVGVGANGTSQVGNMLQGIALRSNDAAAPPLGPGQPNEPGVQNNQIGGTVPGDGNTVAFNGAAGVAVFGNPVATNGDQNAGNAIEGNSIFLNGRRFMAVSSAPTPLLGIDLSNSFPFPREDGLTPNDSKGHGAANDPNNFQNFPVLTAVTLPAGGGTTIAGTFSEAAEPNTTLRLEFFANNPDPLNLPAEGQTFLGFMNVTTNASGQAAFSLTVATTLTSAQSVTATATSTTADPSSPAGQPNSGNTSEFSAPFGPPASITVVAGSPQSATVNTAFATPLAVVVKDQFGHPVPGASVTFLAPAGALPSGAFAGSGTMVTVTTDNSGVATAPTFTANTTPGSYTVTAAVNGVSAPASFSLTNTAGPAANILVSSGSGQAAPLNTAFAAPLVVTVVDPFGNPVPGVSVTFAGPASGAGATFSPGATGTTNAAGQLSVTATANGTIGTYTVTATAAGVATPATFTLTNLGPFGRKSVGVFDPVTATWYLRSTNSAGAPDAGQFQYGPPGSIPVSGNWNGSGPDPIGVFDPTHFIWFLRNETSAGPPDAGQFQYGAPGFVPVTGDWHNSGHTGVGVFDPTTATWLLRNEPNAGFPDAGVFRYGVAGGIPVVGDWTGTGHLGIGIFDPATFTWYLRSSVSEGAPDVGVFQYGGVGFKAVAGDWTNAGHAGIGVFDPATATFYLRTEPSAGAPDAGQFAFGGQNFLPVAGSFPPQTQTLLAADGEGPGAGPLSQGQLQSAVAGALGRLSAAGADPALVQSLGSATFDVGDLLPGVLGETDVATRHVIISADAAGHGWFADPTPGQDEEFAPGGPGSPLVALPGSPAAGKEDLLTTVLHEMGHLAGRPDGDSGLMAGALGLGTRNLGALDQVFATLGGQALSTA